MRGCAQIVFLMQLTFTEFASASEIVLEKILSFVNFPHQFPTCVFIGIKNWVFVTSFGLKGGEKKTRF